MEYAAGPCRVPVVQGNTPKVVCAELVEAPSFFCGA
jgi:hypothetical protein